MTSQYGRSASRDFVLFQFLVNLPAGRGVPLSEMMNAVGVMDPQSVRSALVRLRKGIPDPASRGGRLRRLQVWWNPKDHLYYNLGNLSGDAVEAQIPAGILNSAAAQLMTRVGNMDNAMGDDGIVRSAQELLDDEETRQLIEQLPLPVIWAIHGRVLQIAQARQILELQAARSGQLLPGGNGV